jgi:hypothetical protein
MPGLVPGIHVFFAPKRDLDGRVIGERSDAVLRRLSPAMTNDRALEKIEPKIRY